MSDYCCDLFRHSHLPAPPAEPPTMSTFGRLSDGLMKIDPEYLTVTWVSLVRDAKIEAHAHLHMMMVARKYDLGWWKSHASAEAWLATRGETVRLRNV